uniref:Uncharacterized protein n=1 Tax=Anguilla anguilla TaxID=7936 RepID=A0A0E9T845_ANGAN
MLMEGSMYPLLVLC